VAQLKNFPHQYNDLRKVRQTVELHERLRQDGADTQDDATFGYALARAGVYRFRDVRGMTNIDYDAYTEELAASLEQRISEELTKPPGRQGARTAAREMRKTIRVLGWTDAVGVLSARGATLLATQPGTPEELDAFQRDLMDLEVHDEAGNASHPVRTLLKLVDQHRFGSRSGMELALASVDDSASGYAEVSALVGMSESERKSALGATTFQMKNAVKILPSFALQAGLMARDGQRRFFVTSAGHTLLQAAAADGPITIRTPDEPDATVLRRSHRNRSGGNDVTASRKPRPTDVDGIGRRSDGRGERYTLTEAEQQAAARLLLERTERHNEIVRAVARVAGAATTYDDDFSFDLLMEPAAGDDPLLLWEIKTVDRDAVMQVRRCTEQLPFYDYFYVRPHWPGREVARAAVFESAPSDSLCEYLQHEHGIAAFTLDGDTLRPLNPAAHHVLTLIQRFNAE
jgi:hypothetical protein